MRIHSGIIAAANTSSGSSRTYGLGYTPSYVPYWSLPATLSAGKTGGLIPSDAIDFSTGNGGSAYASLNAWIAACNTAGVAGAIGTDNGAFTISPGSVSGTRLEHGIYGYGSSMPKITAPASGTSRSGCWLRGGTYDVTIRGIEFVNFHIVFGMSRPYLPLDKSGSTDVNPYHSGSDPVAVAIGTSSVGSLSMLRVGKITLSGSGDILSITSARQLQGSAYPFSTSELDPSAPDLIGSSVTNATPSTLKDAINAYTSTSGFSAVLNSNNEVLVLRTTGPGDPVTMTPTTTGSLVATCETDGIDVDMSYCKFTDCNLAIGVILDVTCAGTITFHKNTCPGTWGLVYNASLRWSDIYAANNEQYDCVATRTTALGRSSSRQPSGSSQSCFNTGFKLGLDSPSMMIYMSTVAYLENNYFHDIVSLNTTDTVNAAVAVDIRCAYDRRTIGGVTAGSNNVFYNRFNYNKMVNMTAGGSEDCNAIYGKPRGLDCSYNYIEACGAPYVNSGLNGAETSSILFKESSTAVGMQKLRIRGNTIVNPPAGIPVIKTDNQYTQELSYNIIENWSDILNGSSGAALGAIKIDDNIDTLDIHSNRFQNCDAAGAYLIYIYNTIMSSNLTGNPTQLEVSNNEFQNDGTSTYPAYTTDANLMATVLASGTISGPSTFFNTATMGYNGMFNAAGTPVGIANMSHNSISYSGSHNATWKPYDGRTNHAPTDIALSVSNVNEDATPGTVVGALSSTDPDQAEYFTYSLTDSAGGKFGVSGTNLTVAGTLDYETATSHAIVVRATDGQGNTFDKNFTITVNDVVEYNSADYDAATNAFYAACSVKPAVSRLSAYNTMITSLKTNGIWTKLDALYILASHDSQAATLNLINPGTNTITLGDAPTFTTDRGYTTDGSNDYLDTNFNPGTAAGHFAQNSAHMAIWSLTTTATGSQAGWYDGTDGVSLTPRETTNNRYVWRINQTSSSNTSNGTSTTGAGWFAANRSSSSAANFYKNGTSVASSGSSSVALNSHNLLMGTITGSSFVAVQFAACSIGQSLSGTEHSNLYSALNTYMTTVGAA